MICGIGISNSKSDVNVGAALRNAGAFGVNFIAFTGKRFSNSALDTAKSRKNIPIFRTDNLYNIIPNDCIPVAVEIMEDSENIEDFVHPEKAFYIFGAEDQTLGQKVTGFCKHKIYIPSTYCLNLATSIGIVLYDRQRKLKNRNL